MSKLNDAIDLIRQWHYDEVRSIADAAILDMHCYEPDDPEEWMSDWLHDTIDGHQHVIYTMQAKCVLLDSDNEDAYAEAFGEAPKDASAAAYMVMEADVREILEARRDEWFDPTAE